MGAQSGGRAGQRRVPGLSDTDITWMPTAFERYLWAMDHGSVPPGWKYGYVYGGYHLMLHGEILKTLCNRAWDWEALKQQNFVSTMSLVPRSLFLEYRFDETFRRLEDWELWLRLGCDGYAGAFCGSIAFTTEARAGVTFGGEYGHDVYENGAQAEAACMKTSCGVRVCRTYHRDEVRVADQRKRT